MITTRHIGNFCNRTVTNSGLFYKCTGIKCYQTASATATSVHTELKWQLLAAACISRPPVITPALSEPEQRYKSLVDKLEEENSLKSKHELRVTEDQLKAKLTKEGAFTMSLEESAKQTAAEFEDTVATELEKFEFAQNITEADKSGDLSSINRALDRSLILTIKQKLGSQEHWILPQASWTPGESIRETCDRVVKSACDDKYKIKVLGNSPCGFYKYKYPKEVRKDGFVGAKVFFFSVRLMNYPLYDADHKPDPNRLWLTRQEFEANVNKSYYQSISQFLIRDD